MFLKCCLPSWTNPEESGFNYSLKHVSFRKKKYEKWVYVFIFCCGFLMDLFTLLHYMQNVLYISHHPTIFTWFWFFTWCLLSIFLIFIIFFLRLSFTKENYIYGGGGALSFPTVRCNFSSIYANGLITQTGINSR